MLPSSQTRYKRLLKEQLDQIDFYPQAATLYSETEHSTLATSAQMQRLIALDEAKMACMRAAEDKCSKLRMGEVPYSNLLNTLGGRLRLWNMVVALKQGKRRSRSRIKRLAKAVGVLAPLSVTLAQAK